MRALALLVGLVPAAFMVWGLVAGDKTYACCETSSHHHRLYWWDEHDFTAEEQATLRRGQTVTRVHVSRETEPSADHIPPAVIPGQVIASQVVEEETALEITPGSIAFDEYEGLHDPELEP